LLTKDRIELFENEGYVIEINKDKNNDITVKIKKRNYSGNRFVKLFCKDINNTLWGCMTDYSPIPEHLLNELFEILDEYAAEIEAQAIVFRVGNKIDIPFKYYQYVQLENNTLKDWFSFVYDDSKRKYKVYIKEIRPGFIHETINFSKAAHDALLEFEKEEPVLDVYREQQYISYFILHYYGKKIWFWNANGKDGHILNFNIDGEDYKPKKIIIPTPDDMRTIVRQELTKLKNSQRIARLYDPITYHFDKSMEEATKEISDHHQDLIHYALKKQLGNDEVEVVCALLNKKKKSVRIKEYDLLLFTKIGPFYIVLNKMDNSVFLFKTKKQALIKVESILFKIRDDIHSTKF
jgi:hypothetical protein